jgi:hypothetical protein
MFGALKAQLTPDLISNPEINWAKVQARLEAMPDKIWSLAEESPTSPTGKDDLSARLWRLSPEQTPTPPALNPPEEFYFVLTGTGRLRVGEATLTVPQYGGVLVGPDQLRQVFNDTNNEVLWLIIGAPREQSFQKLKSSSLEKPEVAPAGSKESAKEMAGVA